MPQRNVNTRYRKKMIELWVEEHGRTCAGWACLPHHVPEHFPLHWDHIIPKSKGGDEYGPGQVLCKHCNEAKHNTDPREFNSLVTAEPTTNPLGGLLL